ncbi:MAG: O-antigen ligase family protein [Clostridia bacterium]|nr:O-antigen ligase family protein [Clostridia bacterium]
MRIKTRTFEKCAVFLVFLFYASTNSFWGYRLFHDSDIFPAVACLLPIFLYFIYYCTAGLHTRNTAACLIFALYAVIVMWSSFNPKLILFYGMCVTLLLDSSISDTTGLLKRFFLFSLLFAFGSFINLFLPALYRSVILPFFSGSSQYARLIRWSNRSIYFIIPGFANQTSFNACHFVYGIGYFLCCRIGGGKIGFKKWVILGLLSICLVLTNKRAHFLFLILSLAITYYATGDNKQKGKRILIVTLIGIVLSIVLYYLITRVNVGVFIKLNTMLTRMADDEDVTSGRSAMYAAAWKYFVQNPLFGIGWEKSPVIIPELRGKHVHNIYIELLCETGIVGFTVFAAFFGYALYSAIRNARKAKSQDEKTSASFCLFMQLFFLFYGMTGNPLYDPPYYIPYFIICAFSIHGSHSRNAKRLN